MDHNERFIRIEGLTKEFDVGRSFLEKGQKLRAVDNVSLTLFPHPLSPTIPKVFPRCKEKLTSCTA